MAPTQPPTEWVPGFFSPRIKRPESDVDHKPPYSAEVKNKCSYNPCMPSWSRLGQLYLYLTIWTPNSEGFKVKFSSSVLKHQINSDQNIEWWKRKRAYNTKMVRQTNSLPIRQQWYAVLHTNQKRSFAWKNFNKHLQFVCQLNGMRQDGSVPLTRSKSVSMYQLLLRTVWTDGQSMTFRHSETKR